MKKGRDICNTLREVRRRIASANGISYAPAECHYEGDCRGTCPRCESEMRALDEQLRMRRSFGLPTAVAGVAVGVGMLGSPMGASARPVNDSILVHPADSAVKLVDCLDSAQVGVVVRGKVLFDSGEPIATAVVTLKGTQKGTVTNLDGRFAMKVPEDAVLRFTFIGCENREIPVKDIGEGEMEVILKDDMENIQGMIPIVVSTPDDVYGRQGYRQKQAKRKKTRNKD